MNASSPPQDAICSARRRPWSRGLFFGESPFSSSTPLLFAQVTLCSLLTAVLHRCLAPFGQSLFVSQILAGIILGPSLLGSNAAFGDIVFPASSFYVVDVFAFFGVIFFVFIIGVKTDLSLLQKSGKKAVAIGICMFSLPLLLNFMLGKLMTIYVPMESKLYRSIFWIGSFQALSSFHVIICLLADLKLMNSEIGRLAISSSTLSGICSSFWILIVFTGKQGVYVEQHTFMLTLFFLGIMVLFTIYIFRPIILWMIKRTSNARSVRESYVRVIFILVLLSALYGEFFGQNFIFGPMILGMAVPDGPPLGSALLDKIEFFVSSIILPIFLVVGVARIDFLAISLRTFVIIQGMALLAFLSKVAGVMLPSIYWKMPLGNALCLGLILSYQGIMEVLILERAKAIGLIDKESYSVMILSIFLFAAILAPVVKFSYKPSKKYMTGAPMTIQHADPNAEIRILACLHYQEHTPSIINLFEASYPQTGASICFYVVHLIDLAGRSAPVLAAHHPAMRNSYYSNNSQHIINAVRYFEYKNRGYVTVYPFTAISPYASMHEDVCSLAAEKRVSLVIVLFHKHPVIHASEEEANSIRAVNDNIIKESPCSVGILIDLNVMNRCSSSLSATDVHRVGVIFLGGPDDREALAYACRMAKHPNTSLTVIRFVDESTEGTYPRTTLDTVAISEYTEAQMKSKQCFYQEEPVKDSIGVVSVIRSLEGSFDLILVGRRHDSESALLAGLHDWNEYPELGCVGDMLVSLESDCKASVLVLQQALSGDEGLDNPQHVGKGAPGILEISLNASRVWPLPKGFSGSVAV